MKTYLKIIATTFIAAGVSALSASAQVNITDVNLLTGAGVQASSAYSGAFNQAWINDGSGANTFVFTEGANDPNPRVNFTGFDSAIDTLRIFDGGGSRASNSVTIYYSSAPNDPASNPFVFVPTGATLVGTFNLPTAAGAAYYTGGVSDDGFTYDELDNLAIPAGTESIYLEFALAQGQYGPSIDEIQAFAPANVPEPSTLALLFVACGGFALMHKVRRSA